MKNEELKNRIFVVDDEKDICEILQFNLENEGFVVDTAYSAEEALNKLSDEHQIILLDVMMGGMSGFRMAEKLRKQGNKIPIVFLTAKDTENDLLTGFSIGADDYISKPFSIKEVVARVKAVLKRTNKSDNASQSEDIIIDKLKISQGTKQVELDDKQVLLTKKEFEILLLLVKNPARVFTREEILDRVWKDEGYVLDRTVDVHITRLRKKFGNYSHYIINRSGYGYCFTA
ncbi:MAG: response regulator transcription factor [Dysgonamonadaceae bacterium]|jgi:two-component system alkaline phosphatase synthesis response regulator PhoP|nr:response regulator transcription factor [Dysgonamonadaceae bacterium]